MTVKLLNEHNLEFLSSRCVGGGGGTMIFSHIRRLGPFFGGFKILNFNTFLGFQKN